MTTITDFQTTTNSRLPQTFWTATTQHVRSKRSAASVTPRSPAVRSYFRQLRAAEMAAWEASGGDYALAGFTN